MNRHSLISMVGFLWIAMMAFFLLSDAIPSAASAPVGALAANLSSPVKRAPDVRAAEVAAVPTVVAKQIQAVEAVLPIQTDPADPDKIIAPYPSYVITQGIHGASYGQMAIDLTAGNGATILSPINGDVTQLFTDNIGNPTLIIENEHYQITLMHGNYSVFVGQHLTIGDPVGTESNNGNTVDWYGQSCRGRDCGYHTHLNIFDKRAGQNVNPLLLIPASQ